MAAGMPSASGGLAGLDGLDGLGIVEETTWWQDALQIGVPIADAALRAVTGTTDPYKTSWGTPRPPTYTTTQAGFGGMSMPMMLLLAGGAYLLFSGGLGGSTRSRRRRR
jgi:hypothetical protein